MATVKNAFGIERNDYRVLNKDMKKSLQKIYGGDLPRFTSLGGYSLVYYNNQHEVFCGHCAATPSNAVSVWEVFDEGPAKSCDDCGDAIESSYGDSDEDNA